MNSRQKCTQNAVIINNLKKKNAGCNNMTGRKNVSKQKRKKKEKLTEKLVCRKPEGKRYI